MEKGVEDQENMTMRARTFFAFILAFLAVSSIVAAHEPAVGRIDNPPFPVEARAINASATILPCEVAAFSFALTNPGSFEETVDLGVSPAFQGSSFSINPVVLRPGQTKEVSLFVVPSCEVYGTFNVELIARDRSDMRQVRTFIGELEILSDGMIEIANGVQRVRIDFNRSGTDVPVHNIGDVDATYDFRVDGPSWVSVRPANATIPAGEEGAIMIVTAPPAKTEEGTYRATIFARSRETGVEYGKVLQVALAPFTEEELRWARLKPWLWAGLIIALLLIILLVVLLVYLIRTREARARSRARRLAEAAERASKRAELRGERFEAAKEKWAVRIKDWFKRVLAREYALVRRSDGSVVRRWPGCLLRLLVLLIVVGLFAFVIWWFWLVISPYAWILWLLIALVLIVVIAVWVLRRLALRRWMARFTSDELDDLKEQAREELEQEFVLVESSAVKAARKERCCLPFAVLLICCLVSLVLAFASWWFAALLGSWWAYSLAVFLGLAILFAILAIVARRRCRARFASRIFPMMESGELYSMETGWPDGVTEVAVRPKVDKEGVVLTVRRHDGNPAFIAPDGVPYQFFEVRASGLSDKEVDETLVKFKVRRSWLESGGCQDKDVMLMRYDPSRSRWVRSDDAEALGSDGRHVGFTASGSGLGYFVIAAKPRKAAPPVEEAPVAAGPGFFARFFGEKKDEGPSIADEIAARKAAREAARLAEKARREEEAARREQERLREEERRRAEMEALLAAQDKPKRRWLRWLGWLLLVLLLLAVVFAVIFWIDPSLMPPWLAAALGVGQAVPAPPLVNDTPVNAAPERIGIPDQVWMRNTDHVMDLSRWFSDPDADDVLVFTHTPMAHIFVSYNGSVATLTPDSDWEGEDQSVFTATDSGGLSVQSNSVRMVVQHGPKTAWERFVDFLKEYMVYLIAGLVALVVILASLILLGKSDEDSQ